VCACAERVLGRKKSDLLLLAIELLLLLEITVHPPDGTVSRRSASVASSSSASGTTELAGGDTDGSLSADESLVELLGERRGVELGEEVLCLETLDTRELGLGLETGLLSLVLADALVNLLESKTGLADLGVLVGAAHGASAEVLRVGDVLVLVEEVLDEGDTAIEVDIDLLTELCLALDGSHHLGLAHGEVVDPALVLGVVEELAELLVEVETDIELKVTALLVLVEVLDTLGVHIGVLDHLPRNGEDELSLGVDLRPVGVKEGNSLLAEGLLAHSLEVLHRLLVKLLSERHLNNSSLPAKKR